jgi:hypothetical protein
MLALKVSVTLFEAYAVLFCGDEIETGIGFVPAGGDASPRPWSSTIISACGFARPKLANCVPATVENRSAEMIIVVIRVFFLTGNPCFMLGFSAVKAFLSRFLD